MFNFLKRLFGRKPCCGKYCGNPGDLITSHEERVINGINADNDKTQHTNDKESFSDSDKEILKNTDEHIVIGKILKITNHPDPKVTKVRITQTEIAPGIVKQILCGGINIEEGRYVLVATVGTKFADFEIGERKIRGELSSGMICSRAELGLPQNDEVDHGIWLLDDNFAGKLGEKVPDLVK